MTDDPTKEGRPPGLDEDADPDVPQDPGIPGDRAEDEDRAADADDSLAPGSMPPGDDR